MGRIYFKPMPWLSIVTVICTAILITLGVWQYQRLQWKTALLADVDRAANAAPLTSLSQLSRAIDAKDAVDFRRIDIAVSPVQSAQNKFVFYPLQGGIFWQNFRAFQHKNETGRDSIIYAATDIIEDKNREDFQPISIDRIIGYVRLSHALGTIESGVKSKANPDKNRYFKFNQTGDWGAGFTQNAIFFENYYLEHVAGASAANTLPPRRPKIRNNHFDYMLTWFSFAGILLIIYVMLHIRAGRLGMNSASIAHQDFGQNP